MKEPNVARVLVVDDEPALRQVLIDALSGSDMVVTAAASGKEAIELARREKVDFVVADFRLGDCTGLDVLDELQSRYDDIPSVVITGYGDAETFSAASRRRPVELMTKPLDVDHLRRTIRNELARREAASQAKLRIQRLRRIARKINRQRKMAAKQLENTCAELADAYRSLSGQMSLQQALLDYQGELIGAKNDDDVFRTLFRLFVRRSGPVFGISLVCNADAELQLVGRFGVPQPDGLRFCQLLAKPIIAAVLANPQCLLMDATDQQELFDVSIRKYLAGVTIMAIPLIPSTAGMVGMAVFYRKGEQPFTEDDIELAASIALPTAVAVGRNN